MSTPMNKGAQFTSGRSKQHSERRKGSSYRRGHGLNKNQWRESLTKDRSKARRIARTAKTAGISTCWSQAPPATTPSKILHRVPIASSPVQASGLPTKRREKVGFVIDRDTSVVRMYVKKDKGAKRAGNGRDGKTPKRRTNVHAHGANKHPQNSFDRAISKNRARARLQKTPATTWSSSNRSEAAA